MFSVRSDSQDKPSWSRVWELAGADESGKSERVEGLGGRGQHPSCTPGVWLS